VIVVRGVGMPRVLVRMVGGRGVQAGRVVRVVGAWPVRMLVLVFVAVRMHVGMRVRVVGRAVPVPVLMVVTVLVLVAVRVRMGVRMGVVVAVRAVVAVCHGASWSGRDAAPVGLRSAR
jgi:hypothetical protein